MQEERTNAGAGSGGPNRLEGLKDKVNALGRLYGDLRAAQVTGRRTRIGVMIIIILVILAYGVAIYSAGKRFVENEVPKFMLALQTSALEAVPRMQKQVREMAEEIIPVYMEEVQKQLRENWPAIRERLEAEAQTLAENVREKAEVRLADRFEAMTERQKEYLLSQFKELADDRTRDLVMDNLEVALRDATLSVLEDRIGKAGEKLAEMNDLILGFLPEGKREPFKARMRRLWEDLGRRGIPE